MGDVIPIVLPSPLCQQLARSLLITSTLWWSGWCGFIAVYFTVKVCLDLKGSNMPNRSSCVTLSRFSGGWCSKPHPYILHTLASTIAYSPFLSSLSPPWNMKYYCKWTLPNPFSSTQPHWEPPAGLLSSVISERQCVIDHPFNVHEDDGDEEEDGDNDFDHGGDEV